MGYTKLLSSAKPKGRVEVNIDGHYTRKTYTNGSLITGEVVIYPETDIAFPSVQITLNGSAQTLVDVVPAPKVTVNNFLKQDMPIIEDDKGYRAGGEYAIPFSFVLPQYLQSFDSGSFSKTSSGPMADYAKRLPPSMGGWEATDMAPSSTRVQYQIQALVARDEDEALVSELCGHQAISVLPSYPEDAPASVDERDVQYTMTKTKTLRRGRFFQKRGYLTASVSPPAAVPIDANGRIAPDAEHFVIVDLTFVPSDTKNFDPSTDLPGIVDAVSGKIDVQTWFSDSAMTRLPDRGSVRDSVVPQRTLCYSTSIPLRCEAITEQARFREVTTSPSGPMYKSSVKVPIRAPALDATILPSFYSRLIARTYSLRLSVNVGETTIKLAAPIQFSVEGSEKNFPVLEDGGLPGFDVVIHGQLASSLV